MKTELKRELFYSAKDLCNFVNEHQITKENIQSIVEDSEAYVLFYWKEAEDFLKKSLKVDDDEFDFFKNEASCKEEIKRLTDFIEPREKRIAELAKENAELKSELSVLKTSDC